MILCTEFVAKTMNECESVRENDLAEEKKIERLRVLCTQCTQQTHEQGKKAIVPPAKNTTSDFKNHFCIHYYYHYCYSSRSLYFFLSIIFFVLIKFYLQFFILWPACIYFIFNFRALHCINVCMCAFFLFILLHFVWTLKVGHLVRSIRRK